MGNEQTFVMIKPDGVQRQLAGEIISRFERKGLKLVAMKMLKVSQDLAEKHYAVHEGKPFYDSLIKFITSSPVVAMVWEGENSIEIVRKVVGATSPKDALPGTIRGDYVIDTGFNMVHASDSPENATAEVALWFEPEAIVEYPLTMDRWLGE